MLFVRAAAQRDSSTLQVLNRMDEPELENIEVVGQITSIFEETVLLRVMKGIGDHKKLAIYTIDHLEKAIDEEVRFTNVFSKEDDRKTVEDRWNELKADIGWEERHYRDLDMLKDQRLLPTVQSEITTEQLRGAIDNIYQDEHLKQVCRQFLGMLEKIESFE